eukprot:COSAG01_NODE_2919_length_6847_cov_3.306165_5_plen_200_part_00
MLQTEVQQEEGADLQLRLLCLDISPCHRLQHLVDLRVARQHLLSFPSELLLQHVEAVLVSTHQRRCGVELCIVFGCSFGSNARAGLRIYLFRGCRWCDSAAGRRGACRCIHRFMCCRCNDSAGRLRACQYVGHSMHCLHFRFCVANSIQLGSQLLSAQNASVSITRLRAGVYREVSPWPSFSVPPPFQPMPPRALPVFE